LVREGDEWRVFLNWAAGVKLPLRLALSQAPELEVNLSKKELVVQPGELFEISLRIKNRSKKTEVVRIAHVIDPEKMSNFLDLVECGFIMPVTLEPGIERQFDARYLILDSLPEGVRQMNLTYDFALLKFKR
jgi:cytochrome c oxidase assembly protein Cox11